MAKGIEREKNKGTLSDEVFNSLKLDVDQLKVDNKFFVMTADSQLSRLGLFFVGDYSAQFDRKRALLYECDLVFGWCKDNPSSVDEYLVQSYIMLEVYASTLRHLDRMFDRFERDFLNGIAVWFPAVVNAFK